MRFLRKLQLLILTTIGLSVSFNAYSNSVIKRLDCTRYTKTGNPFREVLQKTSITFDVPSKIAEMTVSYRNRIRKDTKKLSVIYWNESSNRLVASTLMEVEKNSLDSPVSVVDADFGNPQIKFVRMGGAADFDEILYVPWVDECKRTD